MRITIPDPATGQRYIYGLYDDSHCLRLTDLLPDGQDFGLLALAGGGDVCRATKTRSKATLARKLVMHFLTLLIDQLVETGDHYQLPIQGLARWRIMGKSKQAVASIARRDKYQMIDLDKSQGMIYELVFELTKKRQPVKRIVRMDRSRYLRLCELANNGKVYDKS